MYICTHSSAKNVAAKITLTKTHVKAAWDLLVICLRWKESSTIGLSLFAIRLCIFLVVRVQKKWKYYDNLIDCLQASDQATILNFKDQQEIRRTDGCFLLEGVMPSFSGNGLSRLASFLRHRSEVGRGWKKIKFKKWSNLYISQILVSLQTTQWYFRNQIYRK